MREIHNTLAKLLESAAIMRGRFHGADLYHGLLVAEFAAYRAPAQKSDVVRRHSQSPLGPYAVQPDAANANERLAAWT